VSYLLPVEWPSARPKISKGSPKLREGLSSTGKTSALRRLAREHPPGALAARASLFNSAFARRAGTQVIISAITLKGHDLLISAGAVLATGMVVTVTTLSDDPVSPCLDHRAAASVICTKDPVHLQDEQEKDQQRLQAQRAATVTASSTR
jgi:hypothetical protein